MLGERVVKFAFEIDCKRVGIVGAGNHRRDKSDRWPNAQRGGKARRFVTALRFELQRRRAEIIARTNAEFGASFPPLVDFEIGCTVTNNFQMFRRRYRQCNGGLFA